MAAILGCYGECVVTHTHTHIHATLSQMSKHLGYKLLLEEIIPQFDAFLIGFSNVFKTCPNLQPVFGFHYGSSTP